MEDKATRLEIENKERKRENEDLKRKVLEDFYKKQSNKANLAEKPVEKVEI